MEENKENKENKEEEEQFSPIDLQRVDPLWKMRKKKRARLTNVLRIKRAAEKAEDMTFVLPFEPLVDIMGFRGDNFPESDLATLRKYFKYFENGNEFYVGTDVGVDKEGHESKCLVVKILDKEKSQSLGSMKVVSTKDDNDDDDDDDYRVGGQKIDLHSLDSTAAKIVEDDTDTTDTTESSS